MKVLSITLKTAVVFVIAIMVIGFSSGCTANSSDSGFDTQDEADYSMEKSVEIVSAVCDSGGAISFTIKNTGEEDILANELSVYVNDKKADEKINDVVALPLAPNLQDIEVGETSALYTITGNENAEHTLKVQAPAGTAQKQIPC